ncbi:MAG TPA: adenylate/guanylate cyclase domain-containing protein [bacterium]|jgi:class 3 adenylate cyclase|nr:adenylate/guanylate cyclase domain-containing protein [bacterium]
MDRPQTRYARSGEINIAYQVVGNGSLDLVCVMGWVSHLDLYWEEPTAARFLNRLASFSRLILFDKRGTGLSDRVPIKELPTLEQRMDDVRAVMDAVSSARAALLGVSEGGPMSALFAATYPERTAALVMYGSYARRMWDTDHPWAPTEDDRDSWLRHIYEEWGTPLDLDERAPSAAKDPRFRQWWATYLSRSASPGAALALSTMNAEIDIRHVLGTIRVPTLILHRADDHTLRVEGARYMAERILGAKYVELPGEDHLPWVGDQDAILDEIEEFLTGVRRGPEPDRVLATVMFLDIVGSTERAAALGDRGWRGLLESYYAVVRRELERYRGREVDTAGDGLLATFDGPARAIRCAVAACQAVKSLGIETRAGLHTGEVEMLGNNIGGIAVHIGARVSALAGPGEVLVSSTVKDLVAGSGIDFQDRGTHTLKGVPGEWRLFAVST